MFSLRVNFKTKVLVMETAEMCGISVSDVLRKVAVWIKSGRLAIANESKTSVMVKDRNGNVINHEVCANYHKNLEDFLTADIENPCQSQQQFRTMLIAACLDVQSKCRPEWERMQDLDKKLKDLSYLPTIQKCADRLGVNTQ